MGSIVVESPALSAAHTRRLPARTCSSNQEPTAWPALPPAPTCFPWGRARPTHSAPECVSVPQVLLVTVHTFHTNTKQPQLPSVINYSRKKLKYTHLTTRQVAVWALCTKPTRGKRKLFLKHAGRENNHVQRTFYERHLQRHRRRKVRSVGVHQLRRRTPTAAAAAAERVVLVAAWRCVHGEDLGEDNDVVAAGVDGVP